MSDRKIEGDGGRLGGREKLRTVGRWRERDGGWGEGKRGEGAWRERLKNRTLGEGGERTGMRIGT